jgi:hypothetical protein
MHIRFSLVALSLVLLSGALLAQEYEGYPENRVRMIWGDNHFPDELYPQNRVIFRNTVLERTTRGMKVYGSVITDFDADRVPTSEKLPTGQLSGIRINVELYSYDMVLERDSRTGKLVQPKINPKVEGNLVPGQMVTVTVDQTFGRYGLAKFELPELSKPLAPGLYRLVARVRLKSQDAKIQSAFKWCSDMYGSRAETITDPDTMESETVFHEVMANAAIHEEVYRDLMDNIGELKDVNLIWVGSILENGELNLIRPEEATARNPVNFVVWSYHLLIVKQLVKFEYELEHVDEIVDAELERKLQAEGASDEQKNKWKKEAVADKKRIRTLNSEWIAQYGGASTAPEQKLLADTTAQLEAVMEQVAAFQNYLTQRYWCFADGWLQYRGWHTVNNPGYAIWFAVNGNDNKSGRAERIKNLQEAKKEEGGLKARWTKRAETWKYYPSEVKQLVFDYLRTKEEKPTWDADKFTEEVNKQVEMDPGKWADYRSDFIFKYLEQTDKLLRQVTTTRDYCVQVWPKALATARDARDDVLTLTYSWEYYIRVTVRKENKEPIIQAWKQEDEALPTLDLSKYYKHGDTAPGTMKAKFDSNLNSIKSDIKLLNFIAFYRRAIDNEVKEKDLPGAKPPSAPSDD